jgi:hypothetical protein
MREPNSLSLNQQYEEAKIALDTYTSTLKQTLSDKCFQQRHR